MVTEQNSSSTVQNTQPSTTKQLHPKAIWIFFFQYLAYSFFIFFFLGGWVISAIIPFVISIVISSENITGIVFILIAWILAFIFTFLIAYFFAKLAYKNWRYALTNDALRVEKGIIWKRYVSIPYERIQNIDILRGIMARILGLSDLHIQTAGQSTTSGFSLFSSSEGRLPGLGITDAETLKDELIKRSKGKQGV